MTTNTDAVRVLRDKLERAIDWSNEFGSRSVSTCLLRGVLDEFDRNTATEPAEHGFTCICDACCKPAERADIQPAGEEPGWAYGRTGKGTPKWAEVQRRAEECGGRVVGNKLSFPTSAGKALFDVWYAENASPSLRVRSVFKPFAAPVSAPVPEAKAEQVDDFSQKLTKLVWEIKSAKSLAWRDSLFEQLIDLLEPSPASAAPAVKHEASELPPLPKMLTIARDQDGDMVRGYTAKDMHAYVLADRAARQAPSIAVPAGSIGDDAEFRTLVARHRLALNETDYDAARLAWDAVTAYIDTRSHVAAAPAKEPK